MGEESRIYFGNVLFRMDRLFEEFIEVGNPDNKIPFDKFNAEDSHLTAVFDQQTKTIADEIDQNDSTIRIVLPPDITADDYEEGSDYAAAFNEVYASQYNLRLIDKKILEDLENQPFDIETRKLPEILIEDKAYVVDVSFGELREQNNPSNIVRFDNLELADGKYIVYYDEKTMKLDHFDQGQKSIKIEQMVVLDPEGVAIKHGLEVKDLPENDSELTTDPSLIDRRINKGELPQIKILDEYLYVDLRMDQLRSANKFWKIIDLSQCRDEYSNKYSFLYNKLKREVIEIPGDITAYPKNAVLVELPAEIVLDPVAVGRMEFSDELAMLKNGFPLQHKLEARLHPISNSYLPSLIHSNRKLLGMPPLKTEGEQFKKQNTRISRGRAM